MKLNTDTLMHEDRTVQYQKTLNKPHPVYCIYVCKYNFDVITNKFQTTSICVEKKNQRDATEWLIALIICSTCFGHIYAHHQELETICVSLPLMVCSALVAGCRRSDAGQQAMRPE